MKYIKGLTRLKISEKVLCIISLIVLAVAMLPVYRLALYSCPFYDDYNYNTYVKSFYEAYGASGILKGMLFTVKEMWYAWQGTYSSIAFMSLTPLFLGESYYFLGVFAVITMIILGSFLFAFSCFKYILKANRYQSLTVASLTTLFLTEFIYTSYQGIFWYNSAVHYTFMHGVMFLMLSCGVKIVFAQRKAFANTVLAILVALLAFLSAGANFVTCLQGMLFLLVLMGVAIICKNKKALYILPGTVVYAVGLYFNVSAPGNSVRGALFTGESAINAIFDSFKQAFIDIPKLTGVSSLIVLAVMLPTIIKTVNNSGFAYKLPGLVTILAFCMYATGYTSSFYAGSEAPIGRTMVAVKFTYQILLIFVVIYWTGWLSRRYSRDKKELNYNLTYYFCLVILFVISFLLSKDQAGGYLSYGSYYYTHTCFAQNFRAEYLNRIDIITNSEEEEVGVPPINFRPWLLIGNSELDENVDGEANKAMAKYYKKAGIYLEPGYYEAHND